MSKARLVITAVVLERRPVAEVVAAYGVSRSWLYELLARYRVEGEAAFEPRSRRPHTSPRATPSQAVELVHALRQQLADAGHDAGPETICWHLAQHHGLALSRATVHPDPDPLRRNHPRAQEAAQVVLHPIRSIDAQ